MSTTSTSEPIIPTVPPAADAAPPGSASLDAIPLRPFAETAPSPFMKEGPTLTRIIGFVGLTLFLLGLAVVIMTRATGQPRLILSEGWGFMVGAFGLALMLYHSAVDGEQEIRRTYGGGALFLIILGVIVSLLPGPWGGPAGSKHVGYYLLPWGIGAAFLGLLFTITFTRNETEERYHKGACHTLLAIGSILTVGSPVAGIFRPDFLAGPGIALALLGIGFLSAYFANEDSSEGTGYTVAVTLGAVGAALVIYALARSIFPTLLFDGSTALRRPNGSLDGARVFSRVLVALACLAPAAIAFTTRVSFWVRIVLGVLGFAAVAITILSIFTNLVHSPPAPFFVPGGLILIALGLLDLVIALGITSDNQFVTLTRRELSSYFLSPIGYIVLVAMLITQWFGYLSFVGLLESVASRPSPPPIPEPILRFYFFDIVPVFVLILVVPALTMRLVAEETRSGSLEVLFTAPVNEWQVIMSKFFATWLFFLITWLPSGLFLIALRIETGVPFDYRPLLSFYVCLAAQGLAFVGMGLFFSTLTRNQIIAAVLTAAGMMVFLVCYMLRGVVAQFGWPSFAQTLVTRLAFPGMWSEALSGRLPIRDVFLYSSLGAFWLFLSAKVLETRKWS